jgi:tRNA (guanine-N7-)-methyltransferase
MRATSVMIDAAESIEFIPANYFQPLDFAEVFSRMAPIEVDLGCGDGAYLASAAEQNPDRNFLGIERFAGRVRSACHKILRARLTNARVLRVEIGYAIMRLLPAASVAVFHLMFPDPWPKRRHAGRRVVTEDFLLSIHRALTPHGTLRISTDQTDYFREIERIAGQSRQFVMMKDEEPPPAISTFEKQFQRDGIEIHRLVLRKVSEVT